MTGGPDGGRWELLFADLEAQLAADDAAALADEVVERTRAAQGAVPLVQRLHTAVGRELLVALQEGPVLRGTVGRVGADWLLLAPDVVVALAAVGWVQGLGRQADAVAAGRASSRLGLRSVLRGLARDRSPVTLVLRGQEAVSGTLDRVGADHVDLAVHALDEPRRAAVVRAVRTVPLRALLSVRRH